MAKNQSRSNKSQSQGRRNTEAQDMDMDTEDYSADQDFDIQDASSSAKQTRQGSGNKRSLQGNQQSQDQQPDILASITPAFQEARRYIEGSPVRAAAIGAVAGGLLMTLFSTEKGRQFAKLAYGYANPMVAKYAREYVSKAAGDLAGNALSQH